MHVWVVCVDLFRPGAKHLGSVSMGEEGLTWLDGINLCISFKSSKRPLHRCRKRNGQEAEDVSRLTGSSGEGNSAGTAAFRESVAISRGIQLRMAQAPWDTSVNCSGENSNSL